MIAKRRKLQRLLHVQITAEVAFAFEQIKKIERQCSCKSAQDECPACAEWCLDSRTKCNRALREPDVHVFAKLFEDCLKRSLEARHFLGVRLGVMTMSWISWSDTLSMSI
jgi:hypothetical protein